MTTVTAFKWVPPFAAGQVRDHRARWMLNEIGWDYAIDLIDPKVQASAAYLTEQPFGQIPVLRETGRPTLFESGAIVLDLAERSGMLWPSDREAQAQVRVLGHCRPQLGGAEPLQRRRDRFLHRRREAQGPAAAGRRGGRELAAGKARSRPRRPRLARRRRLQPRPTSCWPRSSGSPSTRTCSQPFQTCPPIGRAVSIGPPPGRRSPTSVARSTPMVRRTWAGIPRCSRRAPRVERRDGRNSVKGDREWSR
jgi:hypothetical protein